MVDSVTLTGDMMDNPLPSPPPPGDLGGFSQEAALPGAGPAPAVKPASGGGGSRRLMDFNTVHNPPVSTDQWSWLRHTLNISTAPWIIVRAPAPARPAAAAGRRAGREGVRGRPRMSAQVVGNDPIWSAGEHGPTWGLVTALLPLLQARRRPLRLPGSPRPAVSGRRPPG